MRDALGVAHSACIGSPRIVCLVPSLTELICDLGLTEHLVGRTGFCVHPRELLRRVPKLGGTKDVRLDRLRELAPTHVIVNVDENRREDVESMRAFVPHVVVTHPLAPEDNLDLFALFGGLFRREREAEQLAAALRLALAQLRQAALRWPRERVLYLIWRDPWMTLARDTYISATLAAAGWDTLPATTATRYPRIDGADPIWATAQRILLPSEPYRFRSRQVAEIAAGYPATLVTPIDGEMTSWYGSRAIAGLRYLVALRNRLAGFPS